MNVSRRARQARIATFCGFISIGGMAYIWSTSVTALREQLGLGGPSGDVKFGLIALCSGIAAAIGSFVVGFFADRYGPRKVIAVGAVIYPCTIIALGQAHSLYFAALLVTLFGVFRGAQDTALNTHGIQVERYYGRSIMSSFHFCYSLGGLLLGLAGSWLAGTYTVSAAIPFAILGGAMMVLSTGTLRWLLRQDELLPNPPEEQRPADHQPVVAVGNTGIIVLMIGFGLLLLGSMVGENVVGDWGQEYVRRINHASPSLAGVAVSIFVGTEMIGRVFGDRLAQFFGRASVVMASGLLAVGGLATIIIFGDAGAALAGLAALGLGLSSIAPLMLSSAGRADPANAGRNIGIVNALGYSGNLVSPATITFIVGLFGLGHLMVFPLILLLPLAVLGPMLMRKSEHIHRNM
jgi:MFS family permease